MNPDSGFSAKGELHQYDLLSLLLLVSSKAEPVAVNSIMSVQFGHKQPQRKNLQMKMLCNEIKVNGIKINASAIYIKHDADTIYKQQTISGFAKYISETGTIQLIPNIDFTHFHLNKDDIVEITDTAGIVKQCKILEEKPFNSFDF